MERKKQILKYLSFDLETIPQPPLSLTKAQLKQFDMKMKNNEVLGEVGVKSTDPFLGRILCIGIYYKNTEVTPIEELSESIYNEDEKKILEEFWEGIASLSPGTKLVGFNTKRFDIPWIRIRSAVHGIKIPNCKVDFFNLNQFKNTPHVDMMIAVKGDPFMPNITVGLGLACESFGIPSPKEGGIDGSQVYTAYLEGRGAEVAEYSKRDTKSTGLLYEKFLELNYGI